MSQIFKSLLPIEDFYIFLGKICELSDNTQHYVFNIVAYKRMLYYGHHVDFLASLEERYHASKHFYIKRELTYNSMANIMRQISKSHKIKIKSKIIYADSKYLIEYYIPVDGFVIDKACDSDGDNNGDNNGNNDGIVVDENKNDKNI